MPLHFLFPSNPLRPTACDDTFSDQFDAIREIGFSVSTCPDAAIDCRSGLRGIPVGSTVVYRGWMLDARQYANLAQAVESAGAALQTSPSAYLAAHHLPRWYPLISELTPETILLDPDVDPAEQLRHLGWEAYFVKDFVKSLKTERGAIIRDPADIAGLITDMKRFRGEIEGGLCVRRVEAFIPDSERRYFVLHGRPFSPDAEPVPDIVRQVAPRIPSPFFSVDIVRRADDVFRVVEIGDGQVSDTVGWTAADLAAIWKSSVADRDHP